jgi:hypothetical protein
VPLGFASWRPAAIQHHYPGKIDAAILGLETAPTFEPNSTLKRLFGGAVGYMTTRLIHVFNWDARNRLSFKNDPAMTQLGKVLYTAKVHTTGGREGGASRSDDGLPLTRSAQRSNRCADT